MNDATLVMSSDVADALFMAAGAEVESAAVLLAGMARTEKGTRLLVRELHWVSDHAYVKRTIDGLTITSAGYVHALARAEALGAVPIWMHTHPSPDASTARSKHDVEVDRELAEVFRIRAQTEVYASVIFSARDGELRFAGSVLDGSARQPLTRLMVVGARWRLRMAEDAGGAEVASPVFDRHLRAFGGPVQSALGRLRVGVIGCGGTGSAVAEQLVRLGVGDLLIVDPKKLSLSNITRVYGSTMADIGRAKVEVLGSHLERIAPEASIHREFGTITEERVAHLLTDRDVVFGCTDDNAGRLVLSRLSSFYLTPVIDVGVVISSTDGSLDGIDGRITVLWPGQACLVCRDRIDLARAQAEQLEPAERQALQAEGYAPELHGIEPAVVSYTSAVASMATAELLERLIGYGPDPEPGEILLRFHEREVSTNSRPPRDRHYCHPLSGRVGVGDCEPFLGQTWRAS